MELIEKPPPADLALPLQQTSLYASAFGHSGHALTVTDNGTPIGHVQMMRGPFGAATTLRGPIWAPDTDEHQRTNALQTLKLRLIEADAVDPALRASGYRAVTTPTWIAEWDIGGIAPERRERLHGKWRNALRQAEHSPLKIKHSTFYGASDHPILLKTTQQAKTRGYKTLPASVTCAMAKQDPGALRLFEARIKRDTIAMMLFVKTGPVVTYHLGWTSDMGRQHNAHHLLLNHAADHYAGLGCTRMDLGHIDTDAAPGLARFKLGTGARAKQLGGSHIRLW